MCGSSGEHNERDSLCIRGSAFDSKEGSLSFNSYSTSYQINIIILSRPKFCMF